MTPAPTPSPPTTHDWVRPVLYATTEADLNNNVMFIVDSLRRYLGDPFCANCGASFPAPSKVCQPTPDPEDVLAAEASAILASEPIIQPKKRASSARVTKFGVSA
jgi:hypothetical protein